MNQDLYNLMLEILAQKKTKYTKDIEFLGTVTTEKDDVNGSKTQITHDIFKIIDQMPNGDIINKIYNENAEYLAGSSSTSTLRNNEKLLPASDALASDKALMEQLQVLSQENGLSLDEFHSQVAEITGIDKAEIKRIGFSKLDANVKSEDKENDEGIISLDNGENNSTSASTDAKSNTQDILNKSAKVEQIDLNQKYDDRYHLYEILNVPQGTILVTAHSDAFFNTDTSKKDHTKCGNAFLYPDGSLHSSEGTLELVGGEYSDRTTNVVKRDGSIEEVYYPSTWKINSNNPKFKNMVLAARINGDGRPEAAIGSSGNVNHKEFIVKELETARSLPKSEETEIRDYLDIDREYSKSIDNRIDELNSYQDYHEEHSNEHCDEEIGLDEADGNLKSGHIHINPIVEKIMQDDAFIASIKESMGTETTPEDIQAIVHANVLQASVELRGMDNASIESKARMSIKYYLNNKDNEKEPEIDNDELLHTHIGE